MDDVVELPKRTATHGSAESAPAAGHAAPAADFAAAQQRREAANALKPALLKDIWRWQLRHVQDNPVMTHVFSLAALGKPAEQIIAAAEDIFVRQFRCSTLYVVQQGDSLTLGLPQAEYDSKVGRMMREARQQGAAR